MNIFIVKCKIYPFDVLVHFGEDKEPMYRKLKGRIPGEYIEELKTLEYKSGKSIMFPTGQTLLWMHEKPKSVYGLSILSHEIFHCACFILERVGIVYCENSDEAYAYLIQFLTEEIYSKLDIKFKTK